MDIDKLRCFIPVGGQGKRLRPLTHDVSKPCIRFLNRPLIEFSMATLAEQGVRNFIFGEYGYTNYTNLFDQYAEGVGFSAKYQISPRVHIKHQPNLDDMGSADSFRLNLDYYDIHDPVLVVQGDNLFDIDLAKLVQSHEANDALMTITLIKVANTEQFGVAELSKDMRIKRFVEKPPPGSAPSNLANAGIYLMSPEVRNIVKSDDVQQLMKSQQRLDFGYDLIPYLVDHGYPVYGYALEVWYDVGTPERYLMAMLDVLNGKMNIRVSEKSIIPQRRVWVQGYSEESIIRRRETLSKYKAGKLFLEGAALIGRHTRIGDYTKIANSNVDNFCILGANSYVERSAVMDGARIGSYVRVTDSIIGRQAVVESTRENPTIIESTSVLGNTVHVREGCKLIRTRVNPGLSLPRSMTYVDKFLRSYEDVVQLAA